MIETLISQMIAYDKGDPKRIQHFMKVHDFAEQIGRLEGLDEKLLYTLETAAVVHDIAICYCEKKYGKCNGKMQEQEGPALAREMLEKLGYDASIIERVCYLVGHHHTYTDIDGMDYQILVEADFLVNLYEDEASKEAITTAYERVFKTSTGKQFCQQMFGI